MPTAAKRPKAAKSRTPSARRRRVRDLFDAAVGAFEDAGISYGHGTSNAAEEASWLILHSLGLPLTDLDKHLDDPVAEPARKAVAALVEERIRTRKPAAYLLKEAWLGPHRFYVDERVIVPRSFIAELLRNTADKSPPASILDLCTGSGCLAILAALRFPDARVDAADLSRDALGVARRNVDDYGLQDRVRLVESDLFSALGARRYDLILSNPPYVKASSMRKLPEEYRREPRLALASGSDGLDHARRILAEAREHLNPGGLLVVEIGHNRKALEKAFPALAFEWPRTSAGAGYVFTLRREALRA